MCEPHSFLLCTANLVPKSNILIKHDGRACLSGFRLLTIIPDELTLDPSNDAVECVDSEQWSAPEILKGGGISKKTDIFSFAMAVVKVRHRRSTMRRTLANFCFSGIHRNNSVR